MNNPSRVAFTLFGRDVYSVSYTHLDVYKRQVVGTDMD